MRLTAFGLGVVAAIAIGNAAFAQDVKTDYDTTTDFSQYKTYMWIKGPITSNPLTGQRVIEDVSAALKAKGLQLVTNDADLCIAAHAATKEQQTLDTFYDGFGGGWRWGGRFGMATTMVHTYEIGTLVVDIFDGRTKEAIWRGTSSKTLSDNPQKNAASLNKAVEKMFRNFPPSAKSK